MPQFHEVDIPLKFSSSKIRSPSLSSGIEIVACRNLAACFNTSAALFEIYGCGQIVN